MLNIYECVCLFITRANFNSKHLFNTKSIFSPECERKSKPAKKGLKAITMHEHTNTFEYMWQQSKCVASACDQIDKQRKRTRGAFKPEFMSTHWDKMCLLLEVSKWWWKRRPKWGKMCMCVKTFLIAFDSNSSRTLFPFFRLPFCQKKKNNK